MTFIVNDRGNSVLTRKVKVGDRWKNKRICNLFAYTSIRSALEGIPGDIENLENEIAECRRSLVGANRQNRHWIHSDIRSLEKELRLKAENYIKLTEYVDGGIEIGTFSNGGGI